MLQIFKPISKLLENYVDFYYIFDCERPKNISYIAFPHVDTAISFFKNVEISTKTSELNYLFDFILWYFFLPIAFEQGIDDASFLLLIS